MAKLPSDAELSKLHVLGFTDSEIGARYGATKQAVSDRFRKMGLRRTRHLEDVNEVLAELWPGVHGNGHHNRSPIQMLRVWMRHQQGDELSDRQVRAAINFERRIRLGNEVLVYLPESEAGFRFDQRLPSDGDLVVRWPDDRPTPSVRAVEMLALPPEDEKPTA